VFLISRVERIFSILMAATASALFSTNTYGDHKVTFCY
jgi:hypothetical protein